MKTFSSLIFDLGLEQIIPGLFIIYDQLLYSVITLFVDCILLHEGS